MTTVKKYRVYCNDETAMVEGWGTTEPTTCYNNNTHTIDTLQTVLVDSVDPVEPTEVKIIQSNATTEFPSRYFLLTTSAEIKSGEEVDIQIPFDIDTNMYSVIVSSGVDNAGDSYDTWFNKDTVVGAVTVTTTGTTIPVSPTVIAYSQRGYFIKFGAAGNRVRITSVGDTTIDVNAEVITTAGDLAYMTYYMVYNKTMGKHTQETLGASILGSSFVPAGTMGGITYRNTSSSMKTITVDIETTFDR
jgi:hypothetical protein